MDTISSAEFRKTYAKIAVDTLVTVNGHVIGKWTPIGLPSEVRSYDGGETWRVERDAARLAAVRMTQAERDAILRKINKGG